MEDQRILDDTRLRPRRKPLADLTNASSLSFSTAANYVKPKLSPKVSPECSSSKSSVSSAGSSYSKIPSYCESPKSTTVAKGISPSGFQKYSVSEDLHGFNLRDDVAICGISVDNCKKVISTSKRVGQSAVNLEYVKGKRKIDSFTAAFSCPLVRRGHKLRNNSLMEHNINQNTTYSEPYQKKKKRCLGPDSSRFADEDIPLEDFIQKQRAYFAEVDSFELPEEAVSESELE